MITDHRFVGLRQWGLHPSPDRPCQYQTTTTNHPSGICGHRLDEHVPFLSDTPDTIREWQIPLTGLDKYAGIGSRRVGDEYFMQVTCSRNQLVRLAHNILGEASV
jgi:hypothetical protein